MRLVVAFGSSVTSSSKPNDLDLALLPGEGWLESPPPDLWTSWARELKRGDLDLIWLPSANWQLARQVALHGIPIYEARDGLWREAQVSLLLRASDSEMWRSRERRYLARVIKRSVDVDNEQVVRKAIQLGQYLHDLEGVMQAGQASFESGALHYTGERLVELLVECSGWINTEVAQGLTAIPPSDYYSSFFSMARTGWITDETAQALAELARLRNALVHHYEDVPLKTLHGRILASLPHWRAYLKALQSHL